MPRPNATYTERIVGPGKFDGSIVEPMDGPINPSSPNEGYNAHVVEIPSYGSLYPNIFECFPPSLVKLHDIWKKIQCNLATIISSFETPFYIIITLGAEGDFERRKLCFTGRSIYSISKRLLCHTYSIAFDAYDRALRTSARKYVRTALKVFKVRDKARWRVWFQPTPRARARAYLRCSS